jgi:hypothetical protein
MTPVKRANSGVARNCSLVRGGGCASPAPVSFCIRRSATGTSGFVPADEFFVSDVAHNLLHDDGEAIRVSHLAVVVSERLLIAVGLQMERLDAYISTLQRSLQETPEVLHTIRMYLTVDVLFRAIQEVMDKAVYRQVTVRTERVSVYRRSLLDILNNIRTDVISANIRHYLSARFAGLSVEQPSDDSFAISPSANRAAHLKLIELIGVHVLRFATYVGFIGFDGSAHFVKGTCLHGKPNTMEHKPCRLLRNANGAVKFVRRYAVLAGFKHPNCREPLLQSNGGVLKDRSGLEGEAWLRVRCVALPKAILGEVANLFRVALRAFHCAVWPAKAHHELFAVFEFREEQDGVSQRRGVHEGSLSLFHRYVNYIIALSWVSLSPPSSDSLRRQNHKWHRNRLPIAPDDLARGHACIRSSCPMTLTSSKVRRSSTYSSTFFRQRIIEPLRAKRGEPLDEAPSPSAQPAPDSADVRGA